MIIQWLGSFGKISVGLDQNCVFSINAYIFVSRKFWEYPSRLCISKLTSVFHHFPSVGPKQLCVLVYLGCTREADTY